MNISDFTINFLTDADNHYLSNDKQLRYESIEQISLADITLYHIQEITFEDKEPRKEALENVLGSLRIEGINFVYIVLGDAERVNFYFGVVKDKSLEIEPPITVYDIGKFVLLPSLKGNFRGSSIRLVNNENNEKEIILNKIAGMDHACYLEGVPGVNEDNENFQGVDRLVDVMLGDKFGVIVIAKPLMTQELLQIEDNLNNAYSGIVPFAKESVQDGTSQNIGTTVSKMVSTSETVGENESKSVQLSDTSNSGGSEGLTKTIGQGTTEGNSSTNNGGSGSNSGTNKSSSEASSNNKSWGISKSKSENTSQGSSTTRGTSSSITDGTSEGSSTSTSKTVEFIKKDIQDWIKYIDETIFTRLDYGKGKGIFITSSLLLSNQVGSLIKLENTMKSLYSGETGNKVSLRQVSLSKNDLRLKAMKNLQIPMCKKQKELSNNEIYARAALSQFVVGNGAYMGSWISTKELSLIAGLPKKEIVGLGLREEVEFGLNFSRTKTVEKSIKLGNIVQSGNELSNVPITIDLENLNKHTFVTGVTGSGKTTTCQKILIDSNLPFLVIEPAKTEYRILTKNFDDLLIFTLGRDTIAPFRLNPFEFFPHESITSRVDMIKASMEAAFDMEAAIPQIIEASIYECYKDYGWNISNNKNTVFEDPFADGVYAFPTLSDLITMTEQVIEKQGFDERLKKDYIGSIKARLQGLVIGSKGLMLDTKRSIDFRELLKRRVVLEIEEVRSSAEKSLIIGFVLTNLIEAVRAEFAANKEFRHITLIEEAHRLLSVYSAGDSLNKKQSVETFTDMLAEVRKYGECLIISDQIPSKLATEVLKNTSTKIVHKIFAQDDKDTIGNTMALTDEQKRFLSNLNTGRAVVFTQGYNKAIQVQIENITNTSSKEEIDDGLIRDNALAYYCQTYKRGVFQGAEKLKLAPKLELMKTYIELNSDKEFYNSFELFIKKMTITHHLSSRIKYYVSQFGIESVRKYLTSTFYVNFNEYNQLKASESVERFLKDVVNDEPEKTIKRYIDDLTIWRN